MLFEGPKHILFSTETPAALNAPEVAACPPRLVGRLRRRVLLRKQRAVRAQRFAILLQHVRVEEVALQRAIPRRNPLQPRGALRIDGILRAGVRRTDTRIVGTWEELGADAGGGVRVRTGLAVLRVGPAGGRSGRGRVGLLPAVRANNDDLEVVAPLACVHGRRGIDTRAPERALVVGDGGGIGAVWGGVERRVTLDVEVEASAEGGVVAELRAGERVVGLEGLQAQVRVGVYGRVVVLEGLNVTQGGLGVLGHGVEGWVGHEGVDGVRSDLGSVAWQG